jgi:hypothetical protein
MAGPKKNNIFTFEAFPLLVSFAQGGATQWQVNEQTARAEGKR